jgi:RHS repeat-associated protein
VYRGGALLATDQPSIGIRHFALDHLGTPRLITSSTGAQVSLHNYYPFGEEATSETQDAEVMKFTGHERDTEFSNLKSSVDYMHARYYVPALGRFLSTDPGPSNLRRPQTWNRYQYAENKPLLHVDTDGRLSNPVSREVGQGSPILHRGGGFGQVREKQPDVKGSASGIFRAPRSGGRKHHGVDIVAPKGTEIVAAFTGRVSEIRPVSEKNSLGLAVFVTAKDGTVAIYAHLSETQLKQGDRIIEGQVIGDAGRSGNVSPNQPASEDHLHFQVYQNGELVDPSEFLNDPENQEKYKDQHELK